MGLFKKYAFLLTLLCGFAVHLFASADFISEGKVYFTIQKAGSLVTEDNYLKWPVFKDFDWDNLAAGSQLVLAVDSKSVLAAEPAIWIDAYLLEYTIYQGDSVFFSLTGNDRHSQIVPVVRKLSGLVSKPVYIVIPNTAKNIFNRIYSIKIGNYEDLKAEAEAYPTKFFAHQLFLIAIVSIIIFSAILTLLIFFIRWHDKNYALLYYAIAVTMAALSNIDLKVLHFIVHFPFWALNLIILVGRFGEGILFFLFIKSVFELKQRLINIVLFIILLYSGISVIAYYICPNPVYFSYLSHGYGLLILGILFLYIYYIRQSNVFLKMPLKSLLLFFVSVFLATILFSLLSLFFMYGSHHEVPVYIGVLALSLAMLVLIIGNYLRKLKENNDYVTEAVNQKNELLKLQKANADAQFETLKSQLNPHFLFNSLSTLSSLVASANEPGKAKMFIEEFSHIFRYILDIRSKDVVSLAEELAFVKSYLYLQEVRFGFGLKVKYDIDKTYINCVVPPLAVQIPAENALKHNVVSKERPLLLEIFTENNFLVIKNNLQKKQVTEVESTRMGIANLKERYSLLSGLALEIIETNEHFIVKIPLLEDEYH
ncbi:MAG TPA: histidine kinase [Bacteroidales bacterium]|nr:histidine kinase [Bacteroidales bacterium]